MDYGWLEQLDEIHAYCNKKNSGFLYASNFSVGVNLFFKFVRTCCQINERHEDQYTAHLEETHHIHNQMHLVELKVSP